MSDPECSALGVPEHLHKGQRGRLEFDLGGERLYRRFNVQTQATVTACIDFRRMSVNREHLSAPAEALLDTEQGGLYEGHGVVAFPVESLRSPAEDGVWRLDNVKGAYELRPLHEPLRCNYAHAEVVVYRDGEAQANIKPTTIKLALRQHLQAHIKIVLPAEIAGEKMPLTG